MSEPTGAILDTHAALRRLAGISPAAPWEYDEQRYVLHGEDLARVNINPDAGRYIAALANDDPAMCAAVRERDRLREWLDQARGTSQYDDLPNTLEAHCEARGLPVSAAALARHERGQGLFIGSCDEYARSIPVKHERDRLREALESARDRIAELVAAKADSPSASAADVLLLEHLNAALNREEAVDA